MNHWKFRTPESEYQSYISSSFRLRQDKKKLVKEKKNMSKSDLNLLSHFINSEERRMELRKNRLINLGAELHNNLESQTLSKEDSALLREELSKVNHLIKKMNNKKLLGEDLALERRRISLIKTYSKTDELLDLINLVRPAWTKRDKFLKYLLEFLIFLDFIIFAVGFGLFLSSILNGFLFVNLTGGILILILSSLIGLKLFSFLRKVTHKYSIPCKHSHL